MMKHTIAILLMTSAMVATAADLPDRVFAALAEASERDWYKDAASRGYTCDPESGNYIFGNSSSDYRRLIIATNGEILSINRSQPGVESCLAYDGRDVLGNRLYHIFGERDRYTLQTFHAQDALDAAVDGVIQVDAGNLTAIDADLPLRNGGFYVENSNPEIYYQVVAADFQDETIAPNKRAFFNTSLYRYTTFEIIGLPDINPSEYSGYLTSRISDPADTLDSPERGLTLHVGGFYGDSNDANLYYLIESYHGLAYQN